MGIQSFDAKFGDKLAGAKNNQADKRDLPKAQIWMNIGFVQTFHNGEKGEDETRFISLPQGMPIDTMEKLEEKGSSDLFRALRAAQNDLLEQIKAKGESLQPGEEVIIAEGPNGLAIQLRRVKAEQASIPADQNPLVRKLAL